MSFATFKKDLMSHSLADKVTNGYFGDFALGLAKPSIASSLRL